jgi:hypothetical protein
MRRRLVWGFVITVAGLMLIAMFLLQSIGAQPPLVQNPPQGTETPSSAQPPSVQRPSQETETPGAVSSNQHTSALDQTAAFYATIYPTQAQPGPSYTAYSQDCGLVSEYECHVDDWRTFSATATSFAETAQPYLAIPNPAP